MIDKVATWVSEHFRQSNSVTLLWTAIADIYWQNFAKTIHQQHHHIGMLIHQSSSSFNVCCQYHCNLSMPLSLQHHLVTPCFRLDIHSLAMELTSLWSVGKLLLLHDLYTCKLCFLPLLLVFCNEMLFLLALLSDSQPILLFASFTYVHASTTHRHLYMPQLFTHCVPTIICVMLRYIMCTIKQIG